MPKKIKEQKIKDEIDKCWEELDRGQISLGDLLKDDPCVFEKNITWVRNNDEMHPFYYVYIDNAEKILVNFPYQEIDIKAFRNGELLYQNKSLRVLN